MANSNTLTFSTGRRKKAGAGRDKRNVKTEIYTLTAAEKAESPKAFLPVRKDAGGQIGEELPDAVDNETAASGIK